MEIYNRYQGNTGKVTRVEEASQRPEHAHFEMPVKRHQGCMQIQRHEAQSRPGNTGGGSKLGKSLDGLLKKLDPSRLEFEDILLMMILFLLYRESGDEELLIMLGAMFLL